MVYLLVISLLSMAIGFFVVWVEANEPKKNISDGRTPTFIRSATPPIIFSLLMLVILRYGVVETTGLLTGGGYFYLFEILIIIYLIPAYLGFSERQNRRALTILVSQAFLLMGAASTFNYFLSSPSPITQSAFRSQLGEPLDKGATLPVLDINKAPLVSEGMAEQIAQKQLSNDPGLGSRVHVGKMEKQIVNNELVWVGFLEPNSLTRWLSDKETPGYVVVSATNPNVSKIVTGYKMRYLADAYFGLSIYRHALLEFGTHLNENLTNFSPEIDDSGRPFWVVSITRNEIGLGGQQVVGILLIDAVTGKVNQYDMNNIPDWVDRVQPSGLIRDQVNHWAELVHGYWNFFFSGTDVQTSSAPPELIYGDDGRAYWYVGLTSSGNDNGITGFLLVDSKDKKSTHYALPGANEKSAVDAVEGLVRANKYVATSPLVFEVDGQPTYVMTLTDSTGIARGYGLVNLHDYQIAVYGTTLSGAARSYADKLNRSSNKVDQKIVKNEVIGEVLRREVDVRHGDSNYLLQVSGVKPVLIGTSDVSELLPMIRVGDRVSLVFSQGDGQIAQIISIKKTEDHVK